MRKAVLYIIFILGIFTNAVNARPIETGKEGAVKSLVQKLQKEAALSSHSSKDSFFTCTEDVINEFVDYDETDFDEHETSLRNRAYFPGSFIKGNSTLDFDSVSSCNKIYYHVNFSRLPRFNYITLRVLRL